MMDWLKSWCGEWMSAWNRFWFTPGRTETICLMRIFVGLMLVYSHLVWTLDLSVFFSNDGVFPSDYQEIFNGPGSAAWSHFYWSDSSAWLWGTHILAVVAMVGFTLGALTRWTGLISFLFVVSYANRASGALFGLDQIAGFLTLYLAIGPSGNRFSIDAILARKKLNAQNDRSNGKAGQGSTDSNLYTMATVSTRLIQLHLCVVYLFAGLGKLQGVTWWDGTAIWGALASHEYQTLNMTWLVHLPWLVNIITLVSVFWELSYAFLIWPRLSRPVWLALAVLVHLGIGCAMGMMTFGLIMLVANLSFVSPLLIERIVARRSGT